MPSERVPDGFLAKWSEHRQAGRRRTMVVEDPVQWVANASAQGHLRY